MTISRYTVRRAMSLNQLFTKYLMSPGGDTLVISLPTRPDFRHCASVVYYALKRIDAATLQYVLIKCTEVDFSSMDIAEFKNLAILAEILSKRRVGLVLMDASDRVYRQCDSLMPSAVWVTSSTGKVIQRGQASFEADYG